MAQPSTGADAPKEKTGQIAQITQLAREVVTAAIAIAIVIVALWMLVHSYRAGAAVFTGNDAQIGAREAAFGRQKDLLLLALGLLGTVTGYYLGRVPAELRAQEAQSTANTSQAQLTDAQAHLTEATTTSVEAVRERDQAKQEQEQLKEDVKRTLGPVSSALSAMATDDQSKRRVLGGQGQRSGEQEAGLTREELEQLRRSKREVDDLMERLG